ncbi:terminase large subunit domain-containing protein [Erythrobacter mangrovi]|uniref:DNA-packaging protein n=1 Tax=Erythrobacter mangrovi TaxID=2739433 RepID=A0A7D4BUJ2_9SPHN|nr:DNA-packaging protein [Erythrobacter mangrovi]
MSRPLSRPGVWARLTPAEREAFVHGLTQEERDAFVVDFRNYAHEGQLPSDNAWYIWLVMAGRGFGKTRAGAEWVRFTADNLPDARIALVAANLGEGRAVMVEGESGILACCPPEAAPDFEPSLRRLTWPNGAQATLYSAAEPESLRGPQHSHACRSGAERDLRQRSLCPGRCPASSVGGRDERVAPGSTFRRGLLDRRGRRGW